VWVENQKFNFFLIFILKKPGNSCLWVEISNLIFLNFHFTKTGTSYYIQVVGTIYRSL